VPSPPRSKAGTAPNFGEVPTILVILEDRFTTVALGCSTLNPRAIPASMTGNGDLSIVRTDPFTGPTTQTEPDSSRSGQRMSLATCGLPDLIHVAGPR